jgi:hypothetical protein
MGDVQPEPASLPVGEPGLSELTWFELECSGIEPEVSAEEVAKCAAGCDCPRPVRRFAQPAGRRALGR